MEDKIKRMRFASICYFLGALGFYIGAILGFISDSSFAFIYLLLGSCFLCLGSAMLNRANQAAVDNENPKANEEQAEE